LNPDPLTHAETKRVVGVTQVGEFVSLLPSRNPLIKVDEGIAANKKYAEQTLPDDDDDEDGENPKIPGVRIGMGTDYTPTGALDIEVAVTPVRNLGRRHE
jgi:hypothetical protein